MAAFLMRSRDNPMKALGMLTFIISLSVGATVLISTAIYMRNAKSQNRVTPARRIIKRRPGRRQPRTFNVLAFKFGKPSEKFLAQDPEGSPERESGTQRTRRPQPPPPPPPCAPCLPPPAPERSRAVPTISGVLASKGSRKGKRGGRKEGNVSSALVSELKMRLEQKIRENNQGYY